MIQSEGGGGHAVKKIIPIFDDNWAYPVLKCNDMIGRVGKYYDMIVRVGK